LYIYFNQLAAHHSQKPTFVIHLVKYDNVITREVRPAPLGGP
jgi:hypothetical protein